MHEISRVFRGIDLGRMLDVGTGFCTFIQTLIESGAEFSEIVGVDSNPKAVEGARSHVGDHGGRITFCHMDSAALAYEQEEFDTVSLANTLHHLARPERTLLEMLRVLRTGGRFIVSEMISDGLPADQQVYRDIHHLLADLDEMSCLVHRHTPTGEELYRMCADIGLEGIEVFPCEYPDPLTQEQISQVVQIVRSRIDDLVDPEARASFTERLTAIEQAITVHGIHIPVSHNVIGTRSTE